MNRKQEISKDLSLIVDGLLMGCCLWISYVLRSSGWIRLDLLNEIPAFSNSYWMLALIIPLSPLLLDLQRYYDHPLTQRFDALFIKIIRAGFWLVLLISISSIFGRLEVPSRSVLILFLLLAPPLLLARVAVTRRILISNYRLGRMGEQSVLVGEAADILGFQSGLTEEEKLELQICGEFDIDVLDTGEIRKQIRGKGVGRVIFASPESMRNGDLPGSCEMEGMEVWIIPKNMAGILGVPSIVSAGKSRALVFRKTTRDFWQQSTKRLMDIVGSLLGLLFFAPFMLAIALIIRFTSPGPVIFSQVRSGRMGRRFTILKFRSMVANAPQLHAGLSEKNELNGPAFKIAQDPRITPFGSFLRRYSLDELPQLVNVLRGEMSLVGPRPLPDYETEQIELSTHRRRLSVKPGLTCLWQIRGRNAIRSFEEWVQLDIEYIDNASLLLDLWIILLTIPAVFSRRGAQ